MKEGKTGALLPVLQVNLSACSGRGYPSTDKAAASTHQKLCQLRTKQRKSLRLKPVSQSASQLASRAGKQSVGESVSMGVSQAAVAKQVRNSTTKSKAHSQQFPQDAGNNANRKENTLYIYWFKTDIPNLAKSLQRIRLIMPEYATV